MTATAETLRFQAEARELLDLVIHSLYSHREVFLRELVSNASDALDKLRFEALRNPALSAEQPELYIRLELEPARRVLRVIDTGIGMTREELVENLGTIARSGTRRFLETARGEAGGAAPALPALIGQFGVGFYAAFMVAGEIAVETRRAGSSESWRWSSRGEGEFQVESIPPRARGTCVELQLKPREAAPDEPEQDCADPRVLAALVRRYSDFVEWPIQLAAAHLAEADGLRRAVAADGVEVLVLNSQKPLWSRPREQVKPEEYAQFYRHLAHGFDDPLETIHFKAEGASEWTALLFLPSERPFDLFDPRRERSRVSLYVKRVFVMADCEALMPPWLRFVRGLVDSEDLPLNVSRELLQGERQLRQIQRRLVQKVLTALAAMRDERRQDFERFGAAFGAILKEGIVVDAERREEIAALALFGSSRGPERATLDDYVARMGSGQEAIYVLSGETREACERSPHLEALGKRGWEALFLTDAVDEFALERMAAYKGKPLAALERGELDLGDAAEREARERRERELRPLLEALERSLAGAVVRVRLSSRLVESPAVLVDDEGEVGPQLARLLRESGKAPPPRRRILELNGAHPLVERLERLSGDPASGQRLADLAELLHGQALLAEGSPLSDPRRFARLLTERMLAS